MFDKMKDTKITSLLGMKIFLDAPTLKVAKTEFSGKSNDIQVLYWLKN